MFKSIFFWCLVMICNFLSEKTYEKTFHQNGQLKSEGWMENNQKNGYWFFYNAAGIKLEEGHFKNDKKVKWWISYDLNSNVIKKSEFSNNLQNGYSIIYKAGNPIKGEKFVKGIKTKQWNSLLEFKNDTFITLLD